MGSPFPGMDPWLEEPALWSGVHASLIVYIRDQIQPSLRPRYVAAVEERVYVSTTDRLVVPDVSIRAGRPDSQGGGTAIVEPDEAVVVEVIQDEIHEPYIEILDLQTGKQVVTVIEVLSPSNKQPGPGRDLYLAKQDEVLKSAANLVEIDLLRGGQHVLAVPEERTSRIRPYDYLVCVSRARDKRMRVILYGRTIRDRLPRVAVPLREPDAEVPLDLQPLLERVYEAGVYADRIDYSRPCSAPLRDADLAWAGERIQAAQSAGQG